MSNMGPLARQQAGRMPTPPKGEPIARYETYLEAQRAVDFLSDNHFPVQAVTIVGTGLQMVERVTGRLTYARVALAGAASGAWFGLIFGLVLSLFGGTDGALLAGPLFGAAAGVLFGIFSYSLTRGRRDFTSASQIVASEYAVLCLAEQAGAARQLLEKLPGAGGIVTSPWTSSGGPGEAGGPGGYQVPPTGTGPYGPYGSPPQGPSSLPSYPAAGGPGAPTQPVGGPPAGAPPAPDEPGLTYGEAIERQRRARQERERLEREGRA